MDFNQPVKNIKGIGAKREAILKEHGILAVKDLLNIFPKKYIDRSNFLSVENFDDTEPGTIKAKIEKISSNQFMKGRQSFFTLKANWQDILVNIRIFNQPYLRKILRLNESYYFYGTLKKENGQYKMINPQFVLSRDPASFFEFEPVYPLISCLPSKSLARMIREILSHDLWVPADLPKKIRDDNQLCTKAEAYRKIHLPKNFNDAEIGIQRFKFDEALKINMGIFQSRNLNQISD
ncbi:MAG: ATP-dependent helicase RecG, partial [Eubacteriaceae bacterium]|nr:ATP-dependent helicase RecG [Eubacteriaceae bacterium]